MSASEVDVKALNENESNDINVIDTPDYATFSTQELLDALKKLKNDAVKEILSPLKELKNAFDQVVNDLKNDALDKFIEEGGSKDDFEYRFSPEMVEFLEVYKGISANVKKHFADLEEQKIKNLHRKRAILNELREIVDAEELSDSFNKVKKLQEEWKASGALPQTNEIEELWANYKALLDRFYNNRSIYFEFKELDRKKNLEAKIALCEKAEQLAVEDKISESLSALNQLHEEYKAIGPVPSEQSEEIWQRFKSASDKFHEIRKEKLNELKVQFDKNLEVKQAIITKMKAYLSNNSDRISEWNEWTKEVQVIQEEWKKAGRVALDKSKEINREFWDASKQFFQNKHEFFKRLDVVREENLKLKEALCKEAEALISLDSIEDAINQAKRIQADWKKIGPAPRKVNDKIFEKFRKICDDVFNRRKQISEDKAKEEEANSNVKQSIIDELSAAKELSLEAVKNAIANWNQVGFVTKSKVEELNNSFKSACEKALVSLKLSEEEQQKLFLEVELGALSGHPEADKIIAKKIHAVRKEIGDAENDIATLRTNIEFFAKSKNADKLRAEVEGKIQTLQSNVDFLQSKLKFLRNWHN